MCLFVWLCGSVLLCMCVCWRCVCLRGCLLFVSLVVCVCVCLRSCVYCFFSILWSVSLFVFCLFACLLVCLLFWLFDCSVVSSRVLVCLIVC